MVNDDVLNVITKMGGIMQERGYPLKNLQSALDELKNESAMDMVLTSKADGEIQEEDLDKLTRVAQADILVSIAITRQNVGPRQQVEFRVTSIDAATNKQIGGETGRSSASGAPISALLEESVLGFMDNFTASIQRHVGGRASTTALLSPRTSRSSTYRRYRPFRRKRSSRPTSVST